MLPTDRPFEKRIATFESRPDDRQLGTALGFGLMGTSNIAWKDDEQFVTVKPLPIPLKSCLVCLCIPLLLLAGVLIYTRETNIIPWLMMALGCFVIAPAFLGLMSWINEQQGDEPYLIFDRSSNKITLPRLSMTVERTKIREVLFLDRFVGGDRFWQVAILVEDNGDWKYIHLFNSAGTGTGMEWLGFKDLYQKIGDSLAIDSRRLKFSKKESESLDY